MEPPTASAEFTNMHNPNYSFPIRSNRAAQFPTKVIKQNTKDTCPILHRQTATLMTRFLEIKSRYGSKVEQDLYKKMTLSGLITRLLTQRPLVFYNHSDSYLLKTGSGGAGGFETIGTAQEQPPLILRDLLSYDEMQLSALLGVSVPTHFINKGHRQNRGKPGKPGTFEPKGIYTGLVGARFERPGLMEWQHIIISADQNTPQNGYGPPGLISSSARSRLLRLWAEFYTQGTTQNHFFPLHKDVLKDKTDRYIEMWGGELYFNQEVYKQRLKFLLEPFLLDANRRAEKSNQSAYVHVVGLGLGVWKLLPEQEHLMLDVYHELLTQTNLPHISDLDFSWFNEHSCGPFRDGDLCNKKGNAIKIHFSKRDPADRLVDSPPKLLVAMYAWDSNAFPGNEYWLGALSASGDPAAACCSTISELQNPDLNPYVSGPHSLIFDKKNPQGVHPESLQ